jgi:hypothetical protein
MFHNLMTGSLLVLLRLVLPIRHAIMLLRKVLVLLLVAVLLPLVLPLRHHLHACWRRCSSRCPDAAACCSTAATVGRKPSSCWLLTCCTVSTGQHRSQYNGDLCCPVLGLLTALSSLSMWYLVFCDPVHTTERCGAGAAADFFVCTCAAAEQKTGLAQGLEVVPVRFKHTQNY